MTIKSIKAYSIEDHPNSDACYDWIRENWHDLSQHCIEEVIDSLKALQKLIGGDLDYCISPVPDRGEYIKFYGYSFEELKKLYDKKDSCPLTGTCYDITVIEGLTGSGLEYYVLSTVHNDTEYLYSDEALEEHCIGEDYYFYENGQYCNNL